MNNLNFKLKIGEPESTEYMTYLGEGRIGVVHYTGYSYKLVVVDIRERRVLWEKRCYETFGGVTVPIYDNGVIYAPFSGNPDVNPLSSARYICAYDLDGKQLWGCSMGTGQYQFMVPLTQTATHIASCNTSTDKLSMISKATGKIVCKAKLAHNVPDYRPWVLAWGDKFVAIGLDKRKDQFAFDIYDPAVAEGFVGTAAAYPDKGVYDPLAHTQIKVVGDAVYFFTEQGKFCKLNLATSEREVYFVVDGVDEQTYYSRDIMQCDNVLYCVANQNDKKYLCKYDLATGKFTSEPFDLKLEKTHGGNVVELCDGYAVHLSDNGAVKYDLTGNGKAVEIPLQDWADYIDKNFMSFHCGSHGEQWLVADGKVMLIPTYKKKTIHTTGEVLCWDI